MSRPWMPLYVGDYLRDTRHLTTLQHGAYLLLLMEYWTKGKLPSSSAELRRITGMDDKQWRRNCQAIASMFSPDWQQDRMERELKKSAEISLKRAVYGAKGGRMSRGKDNLERLSVVRPFPSKS